MNQVVEQLDRKLRTLDPERARYLESLVRKAIERADGTAEDGSVNGWPVGYFEQTAGAFAGEEFERAPQGELPSRDEW